VAGVAESAAKRREERAYLYKYAKNTSQRYDLNLKFLVLVFLEQRCNRMVT
jgi:hypothetical protein